jgi:hypothetical protein
MYETDHAVRATLIVLNERKLLDVWPDNDLMQLIIKDTEEILSAEDEDYDDGQPSWEQEWEDFGERYSDEY